jgi:predicted nucleotidyltransferase
MNLTEQQVEIIKRWAASSPYVQAVRLFGSGAKGCARPDSDVDLAVTASVGHYVALAAKRETELREKTGVQLNIHDFVRNKGQRL